MYEEEEEDEVEEEELIKDFKIVMALKCICRVNVSVAL